MDDEELKDVFGRMASGDDSESARIAPDCN